MKFLLAPAATLAITMPLAAVHPRLGIFIAIAGLVIAAITGLGLYANRLDD